MPCGGMKGVAFLRRAIDVARDDLAVPVNELGHIGVVVDIDDRALAFLEPQQRARKLAVVERRRDDVIRRQLGEPGGDP